MGLAIKLTNDTFIEKARKIHGDKYDYSKVNYINSSTKVCIICPEHGEFWQTPHDHFSCNGCPLCSKEKRQQENHKKNSQLFFEKACKVHGDKYDYSKVEYKDNITKVCIICPEHGEFWQTPKNHTNLKQGCPICGLHNFVDTDIFIKKIKNIFGDEYDYSKVNYIDNRTKVCLICPKHGEFWQAPSQLYKAHGCAKCKREKNSEKFWEMRTCPICGKQFRVRKKYEKITCSEQCHKKYCEIHEKEIKEKHRNSLIKAFSNMTIEQKKKIQYNREQTFLKKYGTTKFQQLPEYREKMRLIFNEIDWSKRSEKIKNEILIPKYTQICNDDDLELLEFRNRLDCTVKCRKCGNIFDVHVLGNLQEKTTTKLCRICHPIDVFIYNSQVSIDFEKILIENNINYIKNNRTIIKPMELDFYLPDFNLAFEINGNYWHSEIKKDEKYHLLKTKLCEEKGVKLIHIFEDEIISKYEIVESRVKNLLNKTPYKIYARQCTIKEINTDTKKKFLIENHIDGDSVSKYNLGLYHNDVLLCVATFGKRKISKKTHFELIRFANKINHSVIGGFSKLLKHFIKTHDPEELITYADIRWSGMNPSKTVYCNNGFYFSNFSKPNYYYMHKTNYLKRLNRCNFMKHKLVKQGYDKSKTEKEIMKDNGYIRIWDCGTMKFIYKKES